MIITDIIEKKRDGYANTEEELRFLIDGLVNKRVEAYQMTAWMMAVCCRGMTEPETAWLTDAMVKSGDTVNLSDLPGIKVDKHSTGGVGDTTTLIIAPLVAACGGTVAKMSGRGLAHSGGTLDKLESIPGVCVEQTFERFKEIVRKTGLCVIGQSANLDPADKIMYALRDVSGTVESIPLIASSIMSKKIAAGAEAIVLDVKVGGGAFMATIDDARALARQMVSIGKYVDRRTIAVITDMNRPLGMAVGNGLEMREAIEVLNGKVRFDDPLVQVCLVLAGQMLRLSGIVSSTQEAEGMIKNAISTGAGLERLKAMIKELGGDVAYIDEPDGLVKVKRIIPVCAKKNGYIASMDAKSIGIASLLLGAGREKVDDRIDHAVGVLMQKRCGDAIKKDEPYAYMYVNDEARLSEAYERLAGAVTVSDKPIYTAPLIYDVIQ